MPQRAALAVYQGTHRDIVRVLSVGAVVFGLGLILGGPGRFGSPGFATARLMPGGCYTWGVLIVAFGSTALAGIALGWRRRVVLSGLYLQGAWFLFWAVTLFSAFRDDSRVASTGWMIYGLVSAIHLMLATTGHQLRGLPR